MNLITKSDLLEQRCQVCNQLLSVGPIKVQSDGTNVCGRCPSPDKNAYHNQHLEKLLSKLQFPCTNEKCQKSIPWKSTISHEKKCPFKYFDCFQEDCKWTGLKSELKDHFKNSHANMILISNQNFAIDLSCNTTKLLLFCSARSQFFVKLNNDNNKSELTFTVQYISCEEDPEDLCLKIQIKDEHETTVQKVLKQVSEFDISKDNSVTFLHVSMESPQITCAFKEEEKNEEIEKNIKLSESDFIDSELYPCLVFDCKDSYNPGTFSELVNHCHEFHYCTDQALWKIYLKEKAQYTVMIEDDYVVFFKAMPILSLSAFIAIKFEVQIITKYSDSSRSWIFGIDFPRTILEAGFPRLLLEPKLQHSNSEGFSHVGTIEVDDPTFNNKFLFFEIKTFVVLSS